AAGEIPCRLPAHRGVERQDQPAAPAAGDRRDRPRAPQEGLDVGAGGARRLRRRGGTGADGWLAGFHIGKDVPPPTRLQAHLRRQGPVDVNLNEWFRLPAAAPRVQFDLPARRSHMTRLVAATISLVWAAAFAGLSTLCLFAADRGASAAVSV